jgi:hypothetical protein
MFLLSQLSLLWSMFQLVLHLAILPSMFNPLMFLLEWCLLPLLAVLPLLREEGVEE